MVKKGGKFVLRLEYAWDSMETVDGVVDKVIQAGVTELVRRGVDGGMASTELGRFGSKSEARRVGETLKGRLGKRTWVDMKIRETRS